MALHRCRLNFISVTGQNNSRILRAYYHLDSCLQFFSTSKQDASKSIANDLIDHHQSLPDTISKPSPALKLLKNCEQFDVTIKYLRDFGFSNFQLEEMVRRMPRVLSARLDTTIKPKIQYLQQLGISTSDVVEVVSKDPWLLYRDMANQVGPSFLALKSLLGSEAAVLKVLKLRSGFLKYNLQKTLVPNVQLMMSSGISKPQIVQFFCGFSRLFLRKPEKIKEYMNRIDKMGFNRNSKMFLHAIRVMSSMSEEAWESKLELFRSLGFAEEDILSMFRKTPQVLGVSERKIKEISYVMLSTGKSDSTLLIKNPEIFIFSVQQRIIPRLKVMDILVSQKLVKRRPSLRSFCKYTDSQFFSKYVLPYSDMVGEIWLTRSNSSCCNILESSR